MLAYLSAETGFIRAFGNRTLLLLLLCALTRTAEEQGNTSLLGLSVNLNPGLIAAYGPLLALLLLIGLRTEADTLQIGRELVLKEAIELPISVRRTKQAVYVLFWTPTIAAIFMFAQYVLNVVPDAPGRCNYDRLRHFYETSFLSGTPSVYCVRDLTKGMPWIYPPIQTYATLLIVAGCAYVTFRISQNWGKARGAMGGDLRAKLPEKES